jgi:hypothetical protein
MEELEVLDMEMDVVEDFQIHHVVDMVKEQVTRIKWGMGMEDVAQHAVD